MHTVRREIAHYSWTKIVAPGTLITLQHTCNHKCVYIYIYIYIYHIEQRHENQNIIFNDTFRSLTLQSNKTSMLWWWLIIYDKCNLQRLGSNVHLVMSHTKNALLKWNSVATLNPTWAHFVMATQNVITCCCKNIHPQVHLVIQYIHHMHIAQLPWFTQ
jgi:hypothetical protein